MLNIQTQYLALTTLHYSNGSGTEYIDLRTIQWRPCRKNTRKFLPIPLIVPMLPLYSSPHRIEAFADDLSVLSTDKAEHQSILSTLDTKCKELDLHLKPEKCISFAFNDSSVDKSATFRLGTGETTNISRNPSKFLGKFLAHCPSAAYLSLIHI